MIDLTKPIRPKPGYMPADIIYHDADGALLDYNTRRPRTRSWLVMRELEACYENIPPSPQYEYVAIMEQDNGIRYALGPFDNHEDALLTGESKTWAGKCIGTKRIELVPDDEKEHALLDTSGVPVGKEARWP